MKRVLCDICEEAESTVQAHISEDQFNFQCLYLCDPCFFEWVRKFELVRRRRILRKIRIYNDQTTAL